MESKECSGNKGAVVVELTGLQIFKYLPGAKKAEGTNCKQCGCPTCMAFALKLAKKQVDIEKCPYVPEELKEKFGEAAKIQQHEIKLSQNLVTGGETVMFRHDKTFVNRTVIAVALDCGDKDFDKKLEQIKNYEIERIGEIFKVDALYLTGNVTPEHCKKVTEAGLAVISENENYSIVSSGSIEQLVEKSQQALNNGVKNILLELEYSSKSVSEVVEELTYIRRAAILKRFEPLTYPVMVRLPQNMDNLQACAAASLLICRYTSIVVLNDFDEALLSTLMTLRQNIYTNPQKPLQVEAKVYEFNDPDKNSPVLLTTNFALTYFAVAGELESLPFGSYLVVTPSDGMSVLTAWSADKFTAELVAKSVKEFGLAQKVNTRSIIIPGLLSHMQDELQEAMPEWKIVVGTIEACQIPEFLKQQEDV